MTFNAFPFFLGLPFYNSFFLRLFFSSFLYFFKNKFYGSYKTLKSSKRTCFVYMRC